MKENPQPFINFDKPTKSDIERVKAAIALQSNTDPVRQALAPLMEQFMNFLQDVRRIVQQRLQKSENPKELFSVEVDYDINIERERFLKDAWNVQAQFWALIETVPTYYFTMLTLLEKLQFPESRHLRLVSVGSGPGIYETCLAKLFDAMGIGGTVTCVDFAPEMAAMQRAVMSLFAMPLRNIALVTADMAEIPLPNASADAVICNNSLQWCIHWKKAVAEMGRLLDPAEPSAAAYVIVHLHKQAMHIRIEDDTSAIAMQPVLLPEIMDELEKNMFTIATTRQLRGGEGSGQAGGVMDRVFLKARFTPKGLEGRWRETKATVVGGQFFKMK